MTKSMLRRFTNGLALGVMLCAMPAVANDSKKLPDQFRELLAQSQENKFGLTFLLKGQTVSAVVTRFDDQVVEGRSQAHERILIRADRIDGVLQ